MMNLETYSTKVRPSTKKRIKALTEANGYRGQRELLEDMLNAYEDQNPTAASKADQYENLMDQ